MHVHKAFRAGFAVIVLGAIFVLAMSHVAVSDPASAYNCGDRGVIYCIVRYSYPNSRTSETASQTPSATTFSFTGQRVTTTLPPHGWWLQPAKHRLRVM
jgi:hypothetical protein